VPTALTLTQRVGRVGLGFGLFVPTQSTSILRTQIKTLEDDAGSSIQFSYDAYRRYQEYHAGPSIGFFISDDVKLGASFLVNYRSLVDMNTATVALAAGDQSAAVTSHSLLDSVQVGAEAVLGLQWRIARNWNFGFVARTPAVRLYQLVQTMDTTTTTGQTPTLDAKEVSGLETTVLTPFRFHSGLSYAFDSSRVALEGNLQLPYADTKAGTDTRLTWNVRAGMRTALSPTLSFGGGLFTDQSPAPDLKEFGDSRINYYGATIAMDMGTPYGIYAKDGKTFERPRSLVFGTTVALSYALGLGMVNRAELSPTNPDLVRINPTDVTAHEITLHIGSTLAE
jgi:hypothetical protein